MNDTPVTETDIVASKAFAKLSGDTPYLTGQQRRMLKQIVRMLLEAPKLDGADREAVQCHVLLRGQIQPLYGALSYTDEGVLKLMTPSKVQHEGQPERTILLEQFFGVADVAAVMIEREMHVKRSSIILG